MNLLLIILCGILMGAVNFGFFLLGYYVRSKKKDENAMEINEQNAEAIKDMLNWMNY